MITNHRSSQIPNAIPDHQFKKNLSRKKLGRNIFFAEKIIFGQKKYFLAANISPKKSLADKNFPCILYKQKHQKLPAESFFVVNSITSFLTGFH